MLCFSQTKKQKPNSKSQWQQVFRLAFRDVDDVETGQRTKTKIGGRSFLT